MSASPVNISESMDLCLLVEDPIVAWHKSMIGGGMVSADEAQSGLVALLQEFSTKLSAKFAPSGDRATQPSWLAQLLSAGRGSGEDAGCPVGLYIYGTVGTGKSMLMDAFFLQTPVTGKVRLHFHAFMKRLHADMKRLEDRADPLAAIAGDLAGKYPLICFDEFHVSDIADAMILYRLLDLLLANGVHFVMTSNYAPSDLYPNGLARDRFLPAIDLITTRLAVHELLGAQDYRMRQLSKGKAYYCPLGKESEAQLQALFGRLANGISVKPSVRINGRRINAVDRTTGAIWFEFDELCATPRSQSDYLELADRFATVIVSNVPPLDSVGEDVARRFTLLVDVLYDMRVKLVCSAARPLELLYGDGQGGESGRTMSRLQEMQSLEYGRLPVAGHESPHRI